jgi:hypothetical protein
MKIFRKTANKRHNKIRRSRENFIFYRDYIDNLCGKHGLGSVCVCRLLNNSHGNPGRMVHFVNVYTKYGGDLLYKCNDDIYIHRSNIYGSELNAIGECIDWIERYYGK